MKIPTGMRNRWNPAWIWVILIFTAQVFQTLSGQPIRRKFRPAGIQKTRGTVLAWDFPIERCHAGIPMGNGRQGLLIWGADSVLKITLGHAGFWDRRWKPNPDTQLRYEVLLSLLQEKNEAGILSLFGKKETDKLFRARQFGGALIEIPLPPGWHLHSADLSIREGISRITIRKKGFPPAEIEVEQFSNDNVAIIRFPLLFHKYSEPQIIPASRYSTEGYTRLSIPPADTWKKIVPKFTVVGVTQKLPQDPALGIACAWKEKFVWITSGLGTESTEGSLVGKLENFQFEKARKTTQEYWASFWQSCPKIQIPDPELMELHAYGLYKMAASAHPEGPALTLQGPFMEHYQLPPWSNDYHFNINVQMAYWPFLSSGQYQRMKPLWKMLQSWLPEMQRNGERFFLKPGALLLPHSTTDMGTAIGGFWTGSIDHACLAWVAQMAWKYYRHTRDPIFLKELALPLLEGALAGYEAQFDTIRKGENELELSLPVSVSPEFKGTRMDAWGRNASFQLAACHAVVRILTEAKVEAGQTVPNRYSFIAKHLPKYTTLQSPRTLEYPEQQSRKIALWEGMDLVESHRHHSHMAQVYPFCTVNPMDSAEFPLFSATYYQWSRKGTGSWTGWSVPWASILLSRFSQTQSAISMLHWGKENFINEGRGTLHDVRFPYITTSQKKPVYEPLEVRKGKPNTEIMQLEAGLGYVEAIHELLVQSRSDGLHVLPSLPDSWKNLRFEGIHTEEGVIVGATVSNGKVTEIRLRSTHPTRVRLHHGMNRFTVNGIPGKGTILDDKMSRDEIHIIRLLE